MTSKASETLPTVLLKHLVYSTFKIPVNLFLDILDILLYFWNSLLINSFLVYHTDSSCVVGTP